MIEICIGSACHLKGSYNVIKRVKELLEEHELTSEVELKSSFCLGACGDGVSVRLNGSDIHSITPETVDEFIKVNVLDKL